MVPTASGSVGSGAEQVAFRYLRKRGLLPVSRNFRCRRGEIDLIMLDANTLVFVEVRYRTRSSFVESSLTVDARKQQKIVHAAAMYIAKNRRFHTSICRFDVVGVDQQRNGEVSIKWTQDAFRANG